MIQPFLVFSDWGLLILRIVLGVILLVRAWPKIKNLKAKTERGAVVAIVEFCCGLGLLLGLLVQIFAFLIVIKFIVTIFKFRKSRALLREDTFDFLIVASALILVVFGGGSFSLDAFFGILLY